MTREEVKEKYGDEYSPAQLNDTRYISKVATGYVEQLGCDISVTKGSLVAAIRAQWGLNSLLGSTANKEGSDHRHQALDAVVIGCINQSLHTSLVQFLKRQGNSHKKLHLDLPYSQFREQLKQQLETTIVSHAPQKKIEGALHEDTGLNYIARHGGMVYRQPLTWLTTSKRVDKILDSEVQAIVREHIAKFDGDIKATFANNGLKHHDGKTLIKRVRVLQSAIPTHKQPAQAILDKTKLGIKDRAGKTFKYMIYGNIHHAEILCHIPTDQLEVQFVTALKASHRAKGIGRPKQPIIKTDQGPEYRFITALHINDILSLKKQGKRTYYRVQKFIQDIKKDTKGIQLRLNTAAKINNDNEAVYLSINKKNIERYAVRLHRFNAIGVELGHTDILSTA